MIEVVHIVAILAANVITGAQPPVSACSTPEYSQLNFWVGHWEVVDRSTGEKAGTSTIEKVHGKCTIKESYSSVGFEGGSLNGYWKNDGKWHQAWMDSTGAFRHFVGGLNSAGQMILVAEQQRAMGQAERLVRMTLTANPDGTVRQYSDFSDDSGDTWKVRYDFLYRPIRLPRSKGRQ